MNLRQGGIPLFKIFGITVYLHWLWFVVGYYEVQSRQGQYSSLGWNIAEYLALFVIVLMHEFGHALACRSVGGEAERIMLWPLGGVAYVSPPPRPGAVLWSIAAGPLVNVALLPILIPLMSLQTSPDLHRFLYAVGMIDIVLLVFNMLPIYPLDGGQILQALLWFLIGRAKSLMVCAGIGILGAIGLAGMAVYTQNYLLGFLALYAGFQAFRGIQISRVLRTQEKTPRRMDVKCPACGANPPLGPYWKCSRCGSSFDTFDHSGICPACGAAYRVTACPLCGKRSPLATWGGTTNLASFPVNPGTFSISPQPPLPVPPPMPPRPPQA
jgi:Zn-dependent protease